MIAGRTMFALLLLASVAAPTRGLQAQDRLPSFDPENPREAFRQMAEYLARDGGRWKSENPSYDRSARRSPTHFGLWFEHVVGGQLLELTIVSYFPDTTLVNSRAYWAWHPERGVLTYTAIDRRGGYSEGITEFPDATTFRTIVTQFGRAGARSGHRDDNFVIDESTHGNTSYTRTAGGEWIKSQDWVWTRERR